MRAKNTNKMRHFSSLLNEHWKRKQRLKRTFILKCLKEVSSRQQQQEKKSSSVNVERSCQVVEQVIKKRRNLKNSDEMGTTINVGFASLIENNSEKIKSNNSIDSKTKTTNIPTLTEPRALLELINLITFVALAFAITTTCVNSQSMMLQSDPRPTIYSGQVSFGLLLSAHSSLGAELSTSASHQVNSMLALDNQQPVKVVVAQSANISRLKGPQVKLSLLNRPTSSLISSFVELNNQFEDEPAEALQEESRVQERRQIFERPNRRQQQQQQPVVGAGQANRATSVQPDSGLCSQVNPNALYAGMGAIWASHQANLVGDSHLAIGNYIYDTCNDLDVGQRQSVRIVSNLNAFQQTTCESPRGSPISLTIAHGDNQLKAIQLLTSFRVPVITTKEPFALEDYHQLTRDQKRYLFSTAPSSRHLAVGALRFSKRIVSRSISSPKLTNQYYKMSSKNGLIVISRNLPSKFINYLVEMIPNHVNYEMLQSNQPIDQIKSISSLETIFIKPSATSSESKLIFNRVSPPKQHRNRRDIDDSSDSSSSNSEDEMDNTKMLSPTILMFITPSEAIDLVTRLRNDLAEVSRYYSLIVATREDISPALKTIFHRGGSSLCSGKAFYTISPKPDEINEFSRYFRDTVQMEGETSDHPLICEFAKHQSTSRISSDLDDISAEPVIKAVWSAAAAFKTVYRRECATATPSTGTNIYRASGTGGNTESSVEPRIMNNRQSSNSSGKTQQSDCLVKMNKSMSNLVQRALKRLDVTINSTGLQSLDGFRIKFDDTNELMTNKFSIRYINKECEITEIGQFSGFKDSSLRIDEETLVKSLESTMPDPWPVTAPILQPASVSQTATSSPTIDSTSPYEAPRDTSATETGETNDNPTGDEKGNDGSGSVATEETPPKRPSKRSRTSQMGELSLSKRKPESKRRQVSVAGPVTAMSGHHIPPGLADTTSNGGSSSSTAHITNQSTNQPVKPMRKLKPFSSATGTTLQDWLPSTGVHQQSNKIEESSRVTPSYSNSANSGGIRQLHDNEQVDSAMDLKSRATTQAPTLSTLPESGGNADLELPSSSSKPHLSNNNKDLSSKTLVTAAATELSSEYVTSPSTINKDIQSMFSNQPSPPNLQTGSSQTESLRIKYLKDLDSTPIPFTTNVNNNREPENLRLASLFQEEQSRYQNSRSKLRSHLKWIYSSWFTLLILGANIIGAFLTLYVLTFLLMKNCDGTMDRENHGIRSMHLLAIIIVFFGSTLFIVHPTPSLCLLRTSWRNFALVLLFGSLLLQTMQTRSLNTLGLGGRPNRLNQFLTLIFMVGVQIAFELQRWRYESANYLHFLNQYFGSSEGDDKRLAMLSNTIVSSQFNPINTFSDHVTPISIQVSEKYQKLLQDYCSQQTDDFLQSQIYLIFIVCLLIIFSASLKRSLRLSKTSSKTTNHNKFASAITSGKLLASQHEANLNLNSSHFQFTSNGSKDSFSAGNIFMVTLISVPIYSISVILHSQGQNSTDRDMISSITMVLIAFVTLIGIFLPILLQIHRYGGLIADRLPGTLTRPVINHSARLTENSPATNQAFTMFPEFAQTGLRRPSSTSGDSSSGAGSRRPFADTKESRRNMGVSLAHLGPSAELLQSMELYGPKRDEPVDSAMFNMKLNLGANEQLSPSDDREPISRINCEDVDGKPTTRRTSRGEKRLVMLDVDPCCPRHGIDAHVSKLAPFTAQRYL